MKKLFNYALLAAALLVGVNVNAGNEVSLSIGGGAATEYPKFTDALKAVCEAAQSNTEADKTEATITLLTDVADFGYVDGLPKDGDKTDRIKLNKGEYITIDLNGKTLTTQLRFNIYRAGVVLTGKAGSKFNTAKSQIFTIYGAGNKTASTGASKFVLDKDVVLTNNATDKINDVYCFGCLGQSDNNYSGIQFDVYGKVFALGDGCTAFATNGSYTHNEAGFSIPQIHFYPGSEVHSSNNIVLTKTLTTENKIAEAGQDPATHKTSASAIYAPGVANLVVEGLVEGGVGIYAKAGHIKLNGAVVRATAAEYSAPIAFGNGFFGCGSAIILDSHQGYGELSGVEISNTTVVSDHGYAIEEVATQGQTKLPDIDVNSGTFVGGQGAISTTAEEREKIKGEGSITGGEWHNTDVTPYLDPNKNTVLEFTDADGKHYQVVVPISKDDMESTIADAAANEAGERYAYIQENVNPEVVDGDITIDFLLVDSAATVIVKSGVVLDAGTLMTEGSQIAGKGTGKIIVEAGGTLIVSGKQGAYTYDANSLVVKASQEASGQILINPAVVLNTTPKATVEFVSNSCKVSDGIFIFQYFGIPMTNVTSVVSSDNTNMTYFDVNRAGTNWQTIGNITAGVVSMNYALFDTPFGFYQIQSNNKVDDDPLQTYTFKGNLFGNTSPKLSFHSGWPGFSNAYMGITDFNALTKLLEEQGHDASVYVYTQLEGTNTLVWDSYNKYVAGEDVKPMNAYMLRNAGAAKQFDLDYTKLVWNPAMDIEPNNAPRLTELSKVGIRVNAANGVYDQVTLLEGDIFTSDYDNGADAEKYMNSEINLYVKGEKDLAIMASDNVENTYIAFNCKNAGRYTMTFNRLQGEGFVIVDTKTNAHIAMAEGTTYEFIADAGEDAYRFMIVRGAQAPTEMQKTNAAVKANKALVNGQIVISNGERFFNVLGTEVK